MTEVFGPFEDVTLEEIFNSYQNGQKRQASVMINYYGTEFWHDYAQYVREMSMDEEKWFNWYVLIVISYNIHFPHPNQK